MNPPKIRVPGFVGNITEYHSDVLKHNANAILTGVIIYAPRSSQLSQHGGDTAFTLKKFHFFSKKILSGPLT
jgi:hypothetical protein